MVELADIEAAWGVALPEAFPQLYALSDWPAVRLPGGELLALRWPLLAPEQIECQRALAAGTSLLAVPRGRRIQAAIAGEW